MEKKENKYGENREMNGAKNEPKNHGLNGSTNQMKDGKSCTSKSCSDKGSKVEHSAMNHGKTHEHTTASQKNPAQKGESCTAGQKGTDGKCGNKPHEQSDNIGTC